MLTLLFFILGLAIGSFLNVCIYRIPKKQSIILPSSHCPHCKKSIRWFDNIPVLSFIILRGKCRFCSAKISPIYIIVELLTGLTIVTFFQHFGLSAFFVIYSALSAALIVVTFVDLKIEEIPDEISLPGMVIGLILSFSFPELMDTGIRLLALGKSFLGLLAGGLSIYLMGAIGKFFFKKEAMGGGDVKLLAMIGTFVGWKSVLLIFFLAPFFGSIVGIILKIKEKREMIPYGPYLSLATVVVILWGKEILNRLFFLM